MRSPLWDSSSPTSGATLTTLQLPHHRSRDLRHRPSPRPNTRRAQPPRLRHSRSPARERRRLRTERRLPSPPIPRRRRQLRLASYRSSWPPATTRGSKSAPALLPGRCSTAGRWWQPRPRHFEQEVYGLVSGPPETSPPASMGNRFGSRQAPTARSSTTTAFAGSARSRHQTEGWQRTLVGPEPGQTIAVRYFLTSGE